MKVIIGLIVLACSGCAMQPMSDGQRAVLMQYAQSYHPYYQQVTPLAPIPQTRQIVCTPSYNNTVVCQ
jgi:hypothetical protein